MCTALPTLASTRFPRLYELSSLVRAALINMGSVLAAKSTVETEPASIATLDMSTKLRRLALDARRARHPFLEKHPMGEFPYEAAGPHLVRRLCINYLDSAVSAEDAKTK